MFNDQDSELGWWSGSYSRPPGEPQQDPNPPIGDESQFQVSPTFSATRSEGSGQRSPVDTTLISNDAVVFYVDEGTLLERSSNSFKNLLPLTTEISQRTLFLEIPSSELEIMLQAVYNIEGRTASSLTDIQTLTNAIDCLPKYGISPSVCITPTSHLYRFILSCAPLHPLEIYALAAQYGIVSLAATVSSHTLVKELSELDEEICIRMGPVYLLRLFQLHQERVKKLRDLLSGDLGLHNPTPACDFDGQKIFRGMWNLAVAAMLPELKPSTTTSMIREYILSYTADLKCEQCHKVRDNRLATVINEWTMASRSIASFS